MMDPRSPPPTNGRKGDVQNLLLSPTFILLIFNVLLIRIAMANIAETWRRGREEWTNGGRPVHIYMTGNLIGSYIWAAFSTA